MLDSALKFINALSFCRYIHGYKIVHCPQPTNSFMLDSALKFIDALFFISTYVHGYETKNNITWITQSIAN